MSRILTLLVAIISLTTFSARAQMPEESTKLSTDQGYKALKIGAKLSDVKSLLEKTPIKKTAALDTSQLDGVEYIYLVDLKKPGYDMFYGHKVARIEVHFSSFFNEFEEPTQTIDRVKIFLEKGDGDFTAMASSMIKDYGSAAPGFIGEEDEVWTWYGTPVMMSAANYYCGFCGASKSDYYIVEFYSSSGG